MTNFKNSILTLLTLSIFTNIKAQDNKNLVKFNVLPLVSSTISFEYERELTNRFSVGSMISLRPSGSIPFLSKKNDNKIIDKSKLGAFTIAPEFRFYVNKKGDQRGFYLGPYVKYSNYKIKSEVEFSENNIKEYIDVSGNLSAFTVGLSLGTQFRLSDKLSLDWRIIGPGYGSQNGKLTGKPEKPLSAEAQNEISTKLNELTEAIDILSLKINNQVTANEVTSNIKSPWFNIRTALSIGYRF